MKAFGWLSPLLALATIRNYGHLEISSPFAPVQETNHRLHAIDTSYLSNQPKHPVATALRTPFKKSRCRNDFRQEAVEMNLNLDLSQTRLQSYALMTHNLAGFVQDASLNRGQL
ncbi:hypothetical protein V2G26_014977 [Clonostachys chloroleuca]